MLSNHEDIPFTQHTDMHRQDTWSLALASRLIGKGTSTALLASSTLMKWTICETPTGWHSSRYSVLTVDTRCTTIPNGRRTCRSIMAVRGVFHKAQ
jgi:hypothetical protein